MIRPFSKLGYRTPSRGRDMYVGPIPPRQWKGLRLFSYEGGNTH
jgi:hypothetical protein